MKREYEKKLKASLDAYNSVMTKLEQVDSGAAEAERKRQEEKVKAQEQRVEHLCGMIARRMLKKDLTRAWTAWHDKYEEETRRKRMLQYAAGSLKNPELFACLQSDQERVG